MQEETIKDPSKNYIESEPVFITDGKRVEILRPADFWANPSEGGE